MNVRLPRLLAILLFVLALPAWGESPDAAAREFYVRYAAGDGVGTKERWLRGDLPSFLKRRMTTKCALLHGLVVATTALSDQRASVDIEALLTRWNAMTGSRQTTVIERVRLDLEREDGAWRISAWKEAEAELAERLVDLGASDQLRLINEQAELKTPVLVEAICKQAIVVVNRGQSAAAENLVKLAGAIAEETDHDGARASVLSVQSILARLAGRRGDGLRLAREAAALAERDGDPDRIARSLLRLARAEENQLATRDVVPLLRVIELMPYVEDLSTIAHAATHLAATYEHRYEYRRALGYATMASRYADVSGDTASRISASLNLAGAYAVLADYEIANEHLQKALALADDAHFAPIVAGIYEALGSTYFGQGKYEKAAGAITRAMEIRGCDAAIHFRARLLARRAEAHLKLGDLWRAEADAMESMRLGTEASDDSLIQDSTVIGIVVRLAQGRKEEALQLALHSPENSLGPRVMGHTYFHAGRIKEAKRTLSEAVDQIERERAALVGDERHRQLFLARRADPYIDLTELLIGTGAIDEALGVAERLKARVLRDLLARGRDRAARGGNGSEELRELEERIRQLNRALITARASGETSLRDELQRTRAALDQVRARFDSPYEPPAETTTEPPITIPENVVVLEYVVGEEKTFVFSIRRSPDGSRRTRAATLAVSRRELRAAVADMSARIDNRDLLVGAASRRLYDLLLRPIESTFRDAESLCVIPDDVLWRVPFHALTRPDGAHVVDHYAVLYAPSLHMLGRSAGRERLGSRPPRLLAFANPLVGEGTAKQYKEAFRSAEIGPLPAAEVEVHRIARLYGAERSRVYVGGAALESRLKSEAKRFDVLHIATHGFVDDHDPMFSSLLLAASPDVKGDDGLLEARELSAMEWNASLAVLSACDTGRGTIRLGEGVIGLSWAFLAAGCPTTVVSQWKVESEATAHLMVDFHRALLKKFSPAEAMRRAQLAVKEMPQYGHPLYWAPFVVLGAGW